MTLVASVFPSVPGGCWARQSLRPFLTWLCPRIINLQHGELSSYFVKAYKVDLPTHIDPLWGDAEDSLFLSASSVRTRCLWSGQLAAGGTATVRRSRAMAMVSCGEAWEEGHTGQFWQKARLPSAPSPVAPVQFWKLRIVVK